jgi:hypothetical protein
MNIILRHSFALVLSLYAAQVFAQTNVDATAIAPVTLSELPPIEESPAEPLREFRHDRRPPLDVWLGARFISGDLVPAVTPTVAPPRMASSFKANSSASLSPADASGAVSRDHVVTMNNAGIYVQDRSGTVLKVASLFTFLGESVSGSGIYYDPRVAYDAAANRWIAIGINDRSSGTFMMVAVTQTGDPLGTWSRYRLTIGQGIPIDFSRLALTRDTIMIGTQFPDANLSYILSIQKSDLFAAAASLPVKQYDFTIYDVTPVTAEDTAVEYIVHNQYEGRLRVKRLDEPANAWRVIDAPVSWSQNTIYAPQLGSTRTLDTGFLYPIEHAVYHNGAIYAVQGARRTTSAIIWWKIDPITGTRVDAGTIEDATKYYAYPSLAVNRAGVMVIGFCVFSSSTYPSAAYVYRDVFGRISNIGELKSGEGSFRWSDRWGDYTTTVTDPTDDKAFWTTQIISLDNAWQTWWAKLEVDPVTTKRRSTRH